MSILKDQSTWICLATIYYMYLFIPRNILLYMLKMFENSSV